jgi:hypothetical protein
MRMADHKVDSITDVRVADEPTSVRVEVVAGAEQVVLTIDWQTASRLIDRMAIVNNEIRHALSVPDWRAQRVRAGCHRVAVGVAALLLLPVLYGIWLWVIGQLDPEAWRLIGIFLLAAPVAYGIIWFIGWVVAGFIGKRDRAQTEQSSPPAPSSVALTEAAAEPPSAG